jgi:hypothetical protein
MPLKHLKETAGLEDPFTLRIAALFCCAHMVPMIYQTQYPIETTYLSTGIV